MYLSNMKNKKEVYLKKTKESATKLKKEFKKSINTALVAAFGFIIALSWRNVITELIENISKNSPLKGELISAIIVTFFGVVGILLVSRFLSEQQ